MSRRPDPRAAAAAAAQRHHTQRPAASQAADVAVAGIGGPDPSSGLAWQPIGGGASGPSTTASAAAAVAMPGSAASTAEAPSWEATAGGTAKGRSERHNATWRRGPLPPPVLAMLVGALDLGLVSVAAFLAAWLLADPLAAPLTGPVPLDGLKPPGHGAAPPAIGGALALAVLLGLVFAGSRGAYRPPALFSLRRQIRALLPAALGAAGCTAFATIALGATERAAPYWGALAVVLSVLALAFGRGMLTVLLRTSPRARAAAAPRAVILATPDEAGQAARLAETLAATEGRAIRLLGIILDGGGGGSTARRRATGRMHAIGHAAPLLGPMASLCAMLSRGEVEQVIVPAPLVAEARGLALLRQLGNYAVEIRLASDSPAAGGRGGTVLLPLADRPISGWAAVFKAVEDYLIALAALAVTAVPMALIALAIRLDSPGPVLFRQRRIGFNGRPFDVLKFRTMYHEAADPTVRCQVREGDPRVTPVGALLRRTSLDELPQIINVLRGEMSIVGPRPHAPGTRAGSKLFEEVTPLYAARHRVKPGLTGLAQVRGWRGPTETEEKLIRRVESDLEYIENWSPWLDIAIILRTLVAVACMRNAC